MIKLTVNGETRQYDGDREMPLGPKLDLSVA